MDWRGVTLAEAASSYGTCLHSERFERALRWQTMQRGGFEFRVVAFEDACVNNWFHLLLPPHRVFCATEQNNRFEREVPGLKARGSEACASSELETVNVGGKAFVIGGQKNHWHFLVNFLPRLLVTQKLAPQAFEGVDHFVLHADVSRFQEELIRRLDLPAPVLRIDRKRERWYRFDELIYPSLFRNRTFAPKALTLVRERLHEVIRDITPTDDGAAILLLRRSETPRRRIHNAARVQKLLAAVGARSFYAEDLDCAQQLATFRDADLVVAPHGAGLANLLACRPGTDVVIFEYKWPSEMQGIALALGLKPRVILSEQYVDAAFEKAHGRFQRRLRDLVVDERQLAAEVAQVAYTRGWPYEMGNQEP